MCLPLEIVSEVSCCEASHPSSLSTSIYRHQHNLNSLFYGIILAGKATAKGVGEGWQCDCHFGEKKDLATNLEGKTILDHFVTYATPSWPSALPPS